MDEIMAAPPVHSNPVSCDATPLSIFKPSPIRRRKSSNLSRALETPANAESDDDLNRKVDIADEEMKAEAKQDYVKRIKRTFNDENLTETGDDDMKLIKVMFQDDTMNSVELCPSDDGPPINPTDGGLYAVQKGIKGCDKDQEEDESHFLLSQNADNIFEALMDDDHNQDTKGDSQLPEIKSIDIGTFPSQGLRSVQDPLLEEMRFHPLSPSLITPAKPDNNANEFEDIDETVDRYLNERSKIDAIQPSDIVSTPLRQEFWSQSIVDHQQGSGMSCQSIANDYSPLVPSSARRRTASFTRGCQELEKRSLEHQFNWTDTLGWPRKIVHTFLKGHLPLPESLRPVAAFLLQMEAYSYPSNIIERACNVITAMIDHCHPDYDSTRLVGSIFDALEGEFGRHIDIKGLFQDSKEELSKECAARNNMQRDIEPLFNHSAHVRDDGSFIPRYDVATLLGSLNVDHIHQDQQRNLQGKEPKLHYKTRAYGTSSNDHSEVVPGFLGLAFAYGALSSTRINSSHSHYGEPNNYLSSTSFKQIVDSACAHLHRMSDEEKMFLWNKARTSWPGPRFEA